MAIHFVNDRLFLFGTEEGIRYALEMPRRKKGPFTDAIQRVRDRHQLVLAGTTKAAPFTLELNTPPTPELKALFSADVAALTLDLGKTLDVAATLTFKDADAARKKQKVLADALLDARGRWQKNRKMLEANVKKLDESKLEVVRKGLDEVDKALDRVKTEVKGKVVSVHVSTEANPIVLTGMMQPAVQLLRETANLATSKVSLLQLSMALNDYANTNGDLLLPPVIPDKKGHPLYSWRVELLPYIEANDLYKRFHRDEPWDSPHNRTLIPLMPKVYASPGDPPGLGKTRYQLLTTSVDPVRDPNGASRTPFNVHVRGGLPFPEAFQDGEANTILVVEASKAVEWTKPEDVPFTTAEKLKRQLQPHGNIFLLGMTNVKVREVSRKISLKTLEAAVTPQAGDRLGPEW
jgi:hypothetical protein